jgi:hypothetical protein
VQQNILNAEYKEDKIFINEVKTLWRENPLRGSQTQDIPYTENKASYKTLVLTYPYAVVIPLTLTRSPSWTLPNQVSYLKGSSIDSFTLWPIPKIDFTYPYAVVITLTLTRSPSWMLPNQVSYLKRSSMDGLDKKWAFRSGPDRALDSRSRSRGSKTGLDCVANAPGCWSPNAGTSGRFSILVPTVVSEPKDSAI